MFQGGNPLTDAQIAQVNEAFNPIISYELDGMTANTVNPITSFFTSYYYNVLELNLAEFLRYFSAYGIVDEPYGDVTEEEFDHLRTLDGFPFPDKENLEDMYVPIHKYPSSVVDAVIFHYSGVHLDQLVEFNGRGEAFYSEEYDAYYNHTSDFGAGIFHCIGGYHYGSYVELYSEDSILCLHRDVNGGYHIYSHLPRE